MRGKADSTIKRPFNRALWALKAQPQLAILKWEEPRTYKEIIIINRRANNNNKINSNRKWRWQRMRRNSWWRSGALKSRRLRRRWPTKWRRTGSETTWKRNTIWQLWRSTRSFWKTRSRINEIWTGQRSKNKK